MPGSARRKGAQTVPARACPGSPQALAYKIGQLKFVDLKEQAKAQLGPKYDARAFPDLVLSGGALPLDVLQTRVQGWIAAQKAAGRSAAN